MYKYLSFLSRAVRVAIGWIGSKYCLLRGSTNVGQRAHDTTGVERGAREDGWAHEEQGAKGRRLAYIETLPAVNKKSLITERRTTITHQPERVLQYRVLRRGVHSTHHGADGSNKTHSKDHPRIGRHDAERKAILEHSPGNESGDCETSTRVLEALVQVGPLSQGKRIAGLAVQEGVGGDNCSCNRCLQAGLARNFLKRNMNGCSPP